MASFSKGPRHLVVTRIFYIPTYMLFTTTSMTSSGHSKWSKIKHDKRVADTTKSTLRTIIARDIVTASKAGGPDPKNNTRLATVIASAKKAGFPKAALDAAIARGQGKSATGGILKNLIVEAMIPPSIAMMIECETDNKARTLQEVKMWIKANGGSATPTTFMFQRRGRIIFEQDDKRLEVDEILEDVILAGAQEIESDKHQNLIIYTEPNQTVSAAETLQQKFGAKAESCAIIWDAKKDTKVPLNDKSVIVRFSKALDELRERFDVVNVYANIYLSGIEVDEAWWELQSKLD